MPKFVKVLATKIGGQDYSPAKSTWLFSERIDNLEVGNANGAAFRYTPLDAAIGTEYRTSTAASTIVADANA